MASIFRWLIRGLRKRLPEKYRGGVALPVWFRMEQPGYGNGIVATFRGHDMWFASPDLHLEPAPEAAMCLVAPWSAQSYVPVRGAAELAPGFLANVRSATALMGTWWGYGPLTYGGRSALMELPEPAPLQTVAGSTGLFFSGGVDSFYSLINNPNIRVITFVVGFDIRLPNRPTWEAMVTAFRAIAHERGIRLVTIFTNLRQHPTLGKIKWDYYHGAALGALAHMQRNEASRWLISASYFRYYLRPWGSHPDLDWRWGSTEVGLVHYGDALWRAEKLASLAGNATVHRHLRVCFTDPRAQGNCGQCEKCVRTRLIYWQDLPGIACDCMPSLPSLDEAIDGLKGLKSAGLEKVYQRFLDCAEGDSPVTAALKRLLARGIG